MILQNLIQMHSLPEVNVTIHKSKNFVHEYHLQHWISYTTVILLSQIPY